MTVLSRACLIRFLNKYAPRIKGAVADYGGAGKWGREVKKILASGKVHDYTALDYKTGYDLMKPIKGRKFNVGICMDMLEHVSNPFIVANNIANSLKKGAILFVTVPFIWGFHQYPRDYFRFTVDGTKSLFSKLHCIDCEFLTDTQREVTKDIVKYLHAFDKEKGIATHFSTRVVGVFEKR